MPENIKQKPKLLLIYPNYSTFVEDDFRHLSNFFTVTKFHHPSHKKPLKFFITLLKSFLFLTRNIIGTKAIFVWFADYHSFLPILFGRIFNKPTYLALGGYDVTCIPKLKYGAFCKKPRALMTGFSIRHASLCLPVAKSLKDEAIQRIPKATFKVLPTGYNADGFYYNESKKQNVVLTVALVDNNTRFKIKGIDRFIEVATSIPEITFYIVGIKLESISIIGTLPSNLVLIPPVARDEMIKYFQMSKVYVQFSIREGLPNAILEAMLCGNIPVGMDAGGISEAMGKHGYLLQNWNIAEAKNLIIKALNANTPEREKARDHVINNFDKQIRFDALRTIFTKFNIV